MPPIASTGEPEIGKVERYAGWMWNPENGDFEPTEGITIRWRFEGERRWRKNNVIVDPEQGQTVESLREQVPVIVSVLAKREAAA